MKPLFLIFGIFFISISSLFVAPQGFLWPGIAAIIEVGKRTVNPEELIYINPTSGVERDLFPIIFEAFANTMGVLTLALAVSVAIASAGTFLLWLAPEKWTTGVRSVTSLLSTIPDVMYVLSAQLVMVWIYTTFDWRAIEFTGAGTEDAILLPALVLAILPTIYFLHSMLDFVYEEKGQDYHELAVSKGMPKAHILILHISRNVLVKFVYQGKFIIGLTVSNLFIVEYLFNNFGMTAFLVEYAQPPVFFVTAMLFFIPIYLTLKLLEVFVFITTKQEVDL
ncbi:Binding-protein-dependent transport system inner membrane component [Salimicrobium halophilum]|uniref:Binding-protein-dependent transport system inner membrane component n=2 Tax=Salimicrobium halophilum TaxID=86666 RepID=A0A1G8T3T4_9BACI|nr:Binding-protein-dependent transport system inner membrane component [Salimicrobium halophilum]